jgi:TonB family protein
MIMLTKKYFKRDSKLKLIMVIPVIFTVMLVLSSCGKNGKPSEKGTEIAPSPISSGEELKTFPLDSADVKPQFPGGDQALTKYILENIHYTEAAKIIETQGKVVVKFAVDIDGSVKSISIVQGTDPYLDAEVIKVVRSLPKFEPGKQNGKPVSVWVNIPITFKLK